MRFISSLQHYFCTESADGLQIHQYAPGTVVGTTGRGRLELRAATDYPWDGRVEFEVVTAPDGPTGISLRIPGWCGAPTLQVNGADAGAARPGSYATVRRAWRPGDRVTLNLPLSVRKTRSASTIDATRGCAALERGPLVYCIEQADAPQQVRLDQIFLADGAPRTVYHAGLLGGIHLIEAPAIVGPVNRPEGFPYGDYGARGTAAEVGAVSEIRAIPYYAWAHRGMDGMRVFIPEASR
jgi:hypothetical protein